MKKFKETTKPLGLDFYSISQNDKGEKEIHIYGFTYIGDSENEDCWKCLEVCGFIQPLADFIQHVKNNPGYVNKEIPEHKQYIEDMTADEMVESINSYFNGHPADYVLDYSDITIDTPCGNYVFPYVF